MSDETIVKSGGNFELNKFDVETGYIEAVVSSIGNEDVVKDVMAQGAFDEYIAKFNSVEGNKLPMLLQHSQTDIVGEWNSFEAKGDLIIGKGQIYTETNAGSDAQAFVKRGLVGSTSIGFVSRDFEYKDDGGRLFNKVDLVETSLVIRPANEKAKIISAKTEDGKLSLKAIERILRESGLSRSEATKLVTHGAKGLDVQSESVDKNEQLLGILQTYKENSDE